MDYTTYLVHHGIKGMKWGVRRYQNPDGSLTAAGRKRYSEGAVTNLLKVTTKGPESNALEKYVEKNKIDLLLNKPESWAKAKELQESYNEILQTKLKDLKLDQDYDVGAIISQYYDEDVNTFLQVQSKHNFDEDSNPNTDGGLWRYFGGSSADEYYRRRYKGDETVPYGYAYREEHLRRSREAIERNKQKTTQEKLKEWVKRNLR